MVVLTALCSAQADFAADDIQSWQLDDGTEVYFIEDYRSPLVSVSIYFPVHTMMSWTIQNDGQIAFAAQLYDSGKQLHREILDLEASMHCGMGNGFARMGGSSLAADFPELVGLMKELQTNRNYDSTELRDWRRTRILSWRTSRNNPRTKLIQTAVQRLYTYPDDPRHSYYNKPRKTTTDSRKAALRPFASCKFGGDPLRALSQSNELFGWHGVPGNAQQTDAGLHGSFQGQRGLRQR